MSNNYIKKKNSTNKIILIYMLSIIPLVLYGTYKNGYLLYNSNYISFIEIFKPLLITTIPILICLILNYIKYKKIKIEIDNLPWIAISLFMPININLLIYICSITGFIILNNFYFKNINLAIKYKIFIIIFMLITSSYSYLNIAETTNKYAYDILDLIIGRSVGGVSSTSLILGMGSYLILFISGYYKKNIIIISLGLYSLLILIFSYFIDVNFTNIAGIFIAIVYLGSFNKFTPITTKMQIIYSCTLGILTFTLSIFLSYYIGVFLAILITQTLFSLRDKYNWRILEKIK